MFYVYAYLRTDGTPYYIGKGKDNRAWTSHRGWKGKFSVHTPKDLNRIVIIENNLTEVGSYAIERKLIQWYGRKDLGTGILHNRTDGGEGASAAVRSIEFRQALSKANTGKKLSAETKEKIGISSRGKPRSEEVKAKIAATKRAKPYIYSEETKAKMSAAHKGKTAWNKGLKLKVSEK